jgi:hypothetical protein
VEAPFGDHTAENDTHNFTLQGGRGGMSQTRRKTCRNAEKAMAPATNCGAGSNLIVVRRPPPATRPWATI